MSRSLRLALAGFVFLAGSSCGDDAAGTGGQGGTAGGDPVAQRYTSGSRLKVRVQRAGDAEQLWDVFDSALGTACQEGRATDGALRCLPLGSVGQVAFTDAACTSPVFIRGLDCRDEAYSAYATLVDSVAACGSAVSTRAFEIGSVLPATPPSLYANTTTGCAELAAQTGTFFELTEVPPETFVALDTVTESRSGLVVTFHQSADGFRVIDYYPFDEARGVPCYPAEAGGASICLPLVAGANKPAYADPSCTMPIEEGVVTFDAGCERPTYAVVASAETCSPELALYEVGPDTSAPYAVFGGGCSSLGGAGVGHAVLGRQIPSSELVALEETTEGTGPARIRASRLDGSPVTRFGRWTTDTGSDCNPMPFADGSTRCAPLNTAAVPSASRVYADALCTELLAEVYPNPCIAPPAYAMVYAGAACELADLHVLAGEHTGPLFVADPVGGCMPFVRSPEMAYLRVGDPTPAELFPPIELVTLE